MRISNYLKWKMLERKPQISIHTECIYVDSIWSNIKELIRSSEKSIKWMVLTPVNYDFTKITFSNNLSYDDYSSIIISRYKQLDGMNQKLGLHVHLFYNNITNPTPDYGLEKAKIQEALSWLKNVLEVDIYDIALGWYLNNKIITDYCKNELKLTVEKFMGINMKHDYEL